MKGQILVKKPLKFPSFLQFHHKSPSQSTIRFIRLDTVAKAPSPSTIMALFGWKSGPPPWVRKAGTAQNPSLPPVSIEAAPAPVSAAAASETPAELVAFQCFLTQSSLRMQTLPLIVPPDHGKPSKDQGKVENPAKPFKADMQNTAIRNKPGLIPFHPSKPDFSPSPAIEALPGLLSTASLPFFPVKPVLPPSKPPCCSQCGLIEELYKEVRCPAGCQICVKCMSRALETNKCPGCLRVLSDGELEMMQVTVFSRLQL